MAFVATCSWKVKQGSADHTNEMTVLRHSQEPGTGRHSETLLPVPSEFQFQETGKLLGQLGPAEPCVAWGAWFSRSLCTHREGLKQKTPNSFNLIQLSMYSKPMPYTLLQKNWNSVYLKAACEHAFNALTIVAVYYIRHRILLAIQRYFILHELHRVIRNMLSGRQYYWSVCRKNHFSFGPISACAIFGWVS